MQPHATLHDLLEAFRRGDLSREEAATRIEGLRIHVLGLDAVERTPVLDIKP